MTKKIAYRVRNWKDYNCSLINRGNLTIWFSEDAIKNWYQKPPENRKRGRAFIYSDTYIELALTIRTLFHLSLRATQGFLEGLVFMLGLDPQVSHYSQLSRRAGTLNIELNTLKNVGKNSTDLVKVISAPYFLATKLEAFKDRGKQDFLLSHDLEDIVSVIDGRPEIVNDISGASNNLKKYLASEFLTLMSNDRFLQALLEHLNYSAESEDRKKIVEKRMHALLALRK